MDCLFPALCLSMYINLNKELKLIYLSGSVEHGMKQELCLMTEVLDFLWTRKYQFVS
jgi:hypothetical protein